MAVGETTEGSRRTIVCYDQAPPARLLARDDGGHRIHGARP
jgi:hypothetical protein